MVKVSCYSFKKAFMASKRTCIFFGRLISEVFLPVKLPVMIFNGKNAWVLPLTDYDVFTNLKVLFEIG